MFSLVKFIFHLLIIVAFFPAYISADELSVDDILDRVDKLYRSQTSFSKMEMQITTPKWSRSMKMDIWTKGMDYTFVLVNYPRKDKGVATLKRKNEMWNFFPKINKVIKVPASMMMSSWMGSDFTNDDLVKESTLEDDYIAKLINEKNSANYEVELSPKKESVTVWGKILVTVSKKDFLPIKQVFFDERGEKIRTMTFGDVKKLKGRKIPLLMELIPHTENKKGHKTIVKYEDIEFDIDIPDSTFTRHHLQKRR